MKKKKEKPHFRLRQSGLPGSQTLLNHNLNTLFSCSLSRISSEDVNAVIVSFLPKPGNCLSY